MKHLKTYNEYSGIKEDAVTGQDSKVTVDDVYIAKLDRELKEYFYSEYGNGSFTEAEMSKMLAFFNGYEEESNAEEVEKEAEEEAEEDGAGDGLDLDI